MEIEIIVLIITNILAPVITGFSTWIMAKRKYNSEVDNTVIGNMKESLEFYKHLSDDNRERLQEMLRRNEQLEREIADLKTQMLKLTMNICMDLTCRHRVSKEQEQEGINNENNRPETNKV